MIMEYLSKYFSEYASKPCLSLRGEKNLLGIYNMIEELLDKKTLKIRIN